MALPAGWLGASFAVDRFPLWAPLPCPLSSFQSCVHEQLYKLISEQSLWLYYFRIQSLSLYRFFVFPVFGIFMSFNVSCSQKILVQGKEKLFPWLLRFIVLNVKMGIRVIYFQSTPVVQ